MNTTRNKQPKWSIMDLALLTESASLSAYLFPGDAGRAVYNADELLRYDDDLEYTANCMIGNGWDRKRVRAAIDAGIALEAEAERLRAEE